MSRVTPVQNSFNGGEISPYMLGRFDHDVWSVSLLEMVGWVPRPQGPMEACPGFEFIANAAGPCRLIALEPYVDQAYVIEASAGQFRFFTNDVRIEALGLPVTLAHPYSYNDILALDYEASEDVLYLFHRDFAPQQ